MAGATRRNEQYVKVEKHVGDVLLDLMNQQSMTVSQLAHAAEVKTDDVLAILNKSRTITASLSTKLGVALGIGKMNLYKAHQRYMETGGN